MPGAGIVAILLFMTIYVLVADSGKARLLRVDGAPRKRLLAEVAALDSPPARRLPQELVSDRTGRVFARARLGRQGPKGVVSAGADNESDPRIVAADRFAARVSRRIDVERRRLAMDGLVIIAAPRFLGRLRAQLSSPTRAIVQRELARDLVRANDAQILRTAFPR
jgi:protein required for attachment to host cells